MCRWRSDRGNGCKEKKKRKGVKRGRDVGGKWERWRVRGKERRHRPAKQNCNNWFYFRATSSYKG